MVGASAIVLLPAIGAVAGLVNNLYEAVKTGYPPRLTALLRVAFGASVGVLAALLGLETNPTSLLLVAGIGYGAIDAAELLGDRNTTTKLLGA